MNHNQPPADTTTTQVETQIKSTNDHNNTRTQQINPNTDTNLDHKMNNRRVKTEINDTEAISTSSKKIKQTIKKNNEWKSNIPESSPFTRNKWTNLTIPHPKQESTQESSAYRIIKFHQQTDNITRTHQRNQHPITSQPLTSNPQSQHQPTYPPSTRTRITHTIDIHDNTQKQYDHPSTLNHEHQQRT